MRSANADMFNHDPEAEGYDQDVRNEADPIRAAYQDVLNWVITEAQIKPSSRVLELGAGTGNFSQLISSCGELVSVDLLEKKEGIARPKVNHLSKPRFFQN